MKIEVLGSIEFEVVVVVVKIESWQYVDDNDIVVVVEKCCGQVVREDQLQWWWEIYWARLPQLSERHEREEETLWF